jgi:6-phosphogluconolactonase
MDQPVIAGHDIVRIFDDATHLAREGAARFAELAVASIKARGSFHVALAGGSTPKAMYSLLAGDVGREIDWGKVHIYWGDERCVPPEHPDSNAGSAMAALTNLVPIPTIQVHRMRGELGSHAAADEYEVLLRALSRGGCLFDLILLGMGTDGHTASLFPGRDFSRDHGHLALPVVAPPASPIKDRVTVTFDAIQASRHALFLIAGNDKTEMLARVRVARREGTQGGGVPPAALVRAETTEWYVDRAASGCLGDWGR